jgi:hypothetical protein
LFDRRIYFEGAMPPVSQCTGLHGWLLDYDRWKRSCLTWFLVGESHIDALLPNTLAFPNKFQLGAVMFLQPANT